MRPVIPRPRLGFTLAELTVALTLTGLVTAALLSVLRSVRRAYTAQAARLEVSRTLREVAAVFAMELRELDPAAGDLLAASSTRLSYRSARSTYFLCRVADPAAGRVTLSSTPHLGVQPLDPETQLLRVYDEVSDDWLSATAVWSGQEGTCPDGPGLSLVLKGLPPGRLGGVRAGAPVRGLRDATLELYRDGDGVSWLGARTRESPGGRWSGVQPVTGPLAPGGLDLALLDASGRITGEPDSAARIVIAVTAQTLEPVTQVDGIPQFGAGHVTTQVAFRNRRR